MLNTGLVSLKEDGKPGTAIFGNAIDSDSPFIRSFGSAFTSNICGLIFPMIGKTVSPTPAEAINVSTPPEPLISSSASIVTPASNCALERPG